MLIFAFGDSITYGAWDSKGGWVVRLRKEFDKKNLSDSDFYCLVYNLGVSGDTTEGLLKRFEPEIDLRSKDGQEKEIIILFSIGINDSQLAYEKKENRVPLKQFKRNLKELISKARKYSDKIIFLGLTPVDEDKVAPVPWNKSICYRSEYVENYDKVIEQVSVLEGIDYVNLRDIFLKNDYKKLLFDGLHPNDEGHKLIYNEVLRYLRKFNLFI